MRTSQIRTWIASDLYFFPSIFFLAEMIINHGFQFMFHGNPRKRGRIPPLIKRLGMLVVLIESDGRTTFNFIWKTGRGTIVAAALCSFCSSHNGKLDASFGNYCVHFCLVFKIISRPATCKLNAVNLA